MKWSQSHLFTVKEPPADAELVSHQLLVRAGFIKKLSAGIYSYGPLALRAIRNFETIVREELNKRGCQEMLMPMVQPKSLWQESSRWEAMGDSLLKFENRSGHWYCLGATHEEVITDFVRHDIKSYRDLPVQLYQIQTKYRDEIRPRFGLMRGREFIMKDAYSFDVCREDALKSYELYREAYHAIFQRSGLNYRMVRADTGDMGGDVSHEFQVLAEAGEDHLLVAGDFAANIEVCPAIDPQASCEFQGTRAEIEEFATPGLKTIADLAQATGIAASQLVKTLFYKYPTASGDWQQVCVLVRGNDEVNAIKLKKYLGLSAPPELLTEVEVAALAGAKPGSCGPVGLKVPVYMDEGVRHHGNYIVGANREGYHLKNVNHPRDFEPAGIADLRMAKQGDLAPESRQPLKAYRGIEVGHIFYLGSKYSKAMSATFQSASGEVLPAEMGCYGIGVTRTVQAAIEQNHDADGMIWPDSLAPFKVHLALLDPKSGPARELAESLYQQLWSVGIDTLLDDREERPGVKFKDADLLGFPLRVVIGRRGLENGEVETVERRSKQKTMVAVDNVFEYICNRFQVEGGR